MKNNMGQPWREFVEELEVISKQAAEQESAAPTIGTEPTKDALVPDEWPNRDINDALMKGSQGGAIAMLSDNLKKRDRQLASAIAERDKLSKQVAHFESSPFSHRNLFESDGDLGHKDYSIITKEQFEELFEYSEECKCQSCAEIRYMLQLRTERDKAVELLREYRRMHSYSDVFEHQNDSETCSTCQKLDASGLLGGK